MRVYLFRPLLFLIILMTQQTTLQATDLAVATRPYLTAQLDKRLARPIISRVDCTMCPASKVLGEHRISRESIKRQMPIKVYIWNFQGSTEAWGHASMSLSDGTHISWWPCGGDERKTFKGNAVKAPPVHCMTLNDDIQSEDGKQPDVTHKIPPGYIKEEAIRTWWQSFSKEENWRAVDQNCSTVVYKALCEGSALSFFPAAEKRQYETTAIWTPNRVDKFVQRLIEHITSQVRPTPSKQGFGNFAGMMS